MENNHKVAYCKEMRLFKVLLFSDVSEFTVHACFHAYEALVEKHYSSNDFKLIINNSGYKPSSEYAHQLIRKLFSNQEYKFNCIKVAIVNGNIPIIERRKESGSTEREGFFSNEQKAVEWICK